MRIEWDGHKSRGNLRKHGVRFQTAPLVFDDPHALTVRDPASDDEESLMTTKGGSRLALFQRAPSWPSSARILNGVAKRWSELFPRAVPNRTKGECMKKLTKAQMRDIRTVAAQKDQDIDFSDLPRVVDWSGAEVGKFYRPPKKPVTLRLDVDVIEWLKSAGAGYQTRANALLRHAMKHYKHAGRASNRVPKRQRAARKARVA
jgi:uncharacterized protein (DUF4415 family)